MAAKKSKENAARDFRSEKIDLGDGFVIELKCKVAGLEYLEDVYDKPIQQIGFDSGRVKDFTHLLTALAIGTYPDMTIEDIKKKIGQIDVTKLQDIISKTTDVFRTQVKNSKKPSQKVTGNLAEKKS